VTEKEKRRTKEEAEKERKREGARGTVVRENGDVGADHVSVAVTAVVAAAVAVLLLLMMIMMRIEGGEE